MDDGRFRVKVNVLSRVHAPRVRGRCIRRRPCEANLSARLSQRRAVVHAWEENCLLPQPLQMNASTKVRNQDSVLNDATARKHDLPAVGREGVRPERAGTK